MFFVFFVFFAHTHTHMMDLRIVSTDPETATAKINPILIAGLEDCERIESWADEMEVDFTPLLDLDVESSGYPRVASVNEAIDVIVRPLKPGHSTLFVVTDKTKKKESVWVTKVSEIARRGDVRQERLIRRSLDPVGRKLLGLHPSWNEIVGMAQCYPHKFLGTRSFLIDDGRLMSTLEMPLFHNTLSELMVRALDSMTDDNFAERVRMLVDTILGVCYYTIPFARLRGMIAHNDLKLDNVVWERVHDSANPWLFVVVTDFKRRARKKNDRSRTIHLRLPRRSRQFFLIDHEWASYAFSPEFRVHSLAPVDHLPTGREMPNPFWHLTDYVQLGLSLARTLFVQSRVRSLTELMCNSDRRLTPLIDLILHLCGRNRLGDLVECGQPEQTEWVEYGWFNTFYRRACSGEFRPRLREYFDMHVRKEYAIDEFAFSSYVEAEAKPGRTVLCYDLSLFDDGNDGG